MWNGCLVGNGLIENTCSNSNLIITSQKCVD